MTYIITVVHWDDGVEIGKQYIQVSWLEAVKCATSVAMKTTVFADGATKADKLAARKEMQSSFEDGASYQDLDNEWTIFISQPEE